MRSLVQMRETSSSRLAKELSDSDWKIINEVMAENDVDPRTLADFLQHMPASQDPGGRKKALGRKLQQIETALDKQFASVLETYNNVEKLGAAVVAARTEVEQKQAIAAYIEYCAKNGIEVIRIAK